MGVGFIKVLLNGCGIIGRAAVEKLYFDSDIECIYIYDIDGNKMNEIVDRFTKSSVYKPKVKRVGNIESLVGDIDIIISTVPWQASKQIIDFAISNDKPLVSVVRPDYKEIDLIKERLIGKSTMLMFGAGLEPGLTEILGRFTAEKLAVTEELHIKCGSIPINPQPPLNYKLLFGGNVVPIGVRNVFKVENGVLIERERFSDIEHMFLPNIGDLEAWNDGMVPWLRDLECLNNMKSGTQKTIRWPGFAERVNLLKEMGFLNEEKIQNEKVNISPKEFTDMILYPHMKWDKEDRDVTILQIYARGLLDGKIRTVTTEMIDYYDEVSNLTSMQRTTAFTLTTLAKMAFIDKPMGYVYPERFIDNNHIASFIKELRKANIVITTTVS